MPGAIENTVIGFWAIMKGGLVHSVNPVAVIAWVLFFIYFLRFRKAYAVGIFWPGILFLVSFFFLQSLVHLGFADFFYLLISGFAGVWDFFRILAAALLAFIGLRIAGVLFQKPSADWSDFFGPIVYWKLETGRMEGRSKGYRIFVLSMKIFFWAVMFSFFHGLHPLPREPLQLLYGQPLGLVRHFLIKMALFEAMLLLPFIVVFVLMTGILSGNEGFRKIAFSRRGMLVFSGACIIGGMGTLAYYLLTFVF